MENKIGYLTSGCQSGSTPPWTSHLGRLGCRRNTRSAYFRHTWRQQRQKWASNVQGLKKNIITFFTWQSRLVESRAGNTHVSNSAHLLPHGGALEQGTDFTPSHWPPGDPVWEQWRAVAGLQSWKRPNLHERAHTRLHTPEPGSFQWIAKCSKQSFINQ